MTLADANHREDRNGMGKRVALLGYDLKPWKGVSSASRAQAAGQPKKLFITRQQARTCGA
jgi:hypothetical protein